MAQTGFTPLQIYSSSTTTNVPTAGNLTNSTQGAELAINIADGKLFYKDSGGVVQVLASKASASTTISFGTTGLTPSTASTGAITVAGTLITSNGGTGLSSYTAGDLPYYSTGTALSKLAIGTNGYILQSNGSAPTWVLASSVVGGAGGSNTQVQYNSSGSLAGSANMVFDGSTLTTLNTAYTGTLTGGTGVVNLGSGQFYKDASGNVGIGTSSPSSYTLYKATVLVSNGSGIGIQKPASGNNAYLYFGYDTTSGGQQQAAIGSISDALSFFTASTERMRIDSSGKLLIGTTVGQAPLSFADTTGLKITLNANSTNYYGISKLPASTGSTVGDGIFAITSGNTSAGSITFNGGGNEFARFDSVGNLIVGSPSYSSFNNSVTLHYDANGGVINVGHTTGSGSGAGFVLFGYNNGGIGSITQNGTTGVLYNLTSDYRLKNNPQLLTGASEFIMALQPKTWDWRDGSGKGVGFIAHEFMEVAKYSGNGTKDEVDAEGKPKYQSIQPSSSEVMANLVALVQEQQALITTMQAKLKDAGILGF